MIGAGRVLAQGSVDKLRTSAAEGSRYVVETDSTEVESALEQLPSVAQVDSRTLGDGWFRLTITPVADAKDRREAIGRTVRQLGASMRELKREAPSLEQMFLELVSGSSSTEPVGEGRA